MAWARILAFVFGITLPGVIVAGDEYLSMRNLDNKMETFLNDNRYPGAVLGVSIDGKLSYLRSYGNHSDGSRLQVEDIMPVSSLSKTLTAVAIMKLVEEGKLNTTTRVFGKSGVLWMLKPLKGAKLDPRLSLITVDHLLRHTAGWKQNIGPLYDPMLNRLYVLRGYRVPDLTKEVHVRGNLLPHHMIRYVMSQKLDYTPGTEYSYYNLGYSMLGRIIEEVTGIGYEEYVKEAILVPAGMWQTRIGAPRKPTVLTYPNQSATLKPSMTGDRYRDLDIEDVIHPEVIDSTLAWHSTVPDVMRLMTCLDGTGSHRLLKRETVVSMLSQPAQPFPQHVDKWPAAGFLAKNDGTFWQVADDFFNDMVFYNDGIYRPITNRVDRERTRAQKLSFVVMFTGNRYKRLKHPLKKIIKNVSQWPIHDNWFTIDLTDVKSRVNGKDTILKFQIPEPHLSAYSNALKNQGYAPQWISAHQFEKKTLFSTIFEKRVEEILKKKQKLKFDETPQNFMVLHGLTNRKLRKLLHRHHDYHLSFVQSYVSSSHDGSLCNVAVLTEGKRRVRHGFKRKLDAYLDLTDRLHKRKYMPIVQSIESQGEKRVVSYILQKVKRNKYKAMHDLSLAELEGSARLNGMEKKYLIYLDSYVVHGKTRFSAIFSREKTNGWLLLNKLSPDQVEMKTIELEEKDYTPQVLVGYELNGNLVYSALWKRH